VHRAGPTDVRHQWQRRRAVEIFGVRWGWGWKMLERDDSGTEDPERGVKRRGSGVCLYAAL